MKVICERSSFCESKRPTLIHCYEHEGNYECLNVCSYHKKENCKCVPVFIEIVKRKIHESDM